MASSAVAAHRGSVEAGALAIVGDRGHAAATRSNVRPRSARVAWTASVAVRGRHPANGKAADLEIAGPRYALSRTSPAAIFFGARACTQCCAKFSLAVNFSLNERCGPCIDKVVISCFFDNLFELVSQREATNLALSARQEKTQGKIPRRFASRNGIRSGFGGRVARRRSRVTCRDQ